MIHRIIFIKTQSTVIWVILIVFGFKFRVKFGFKFVIIFGYLLFIRINFKQIVFSESYISVILYEDEPIADWLFCILCGGRPELHE